jgi:hypothetical protein
LSFGRRSLVDLHQRAGDAVADGAGLRGDAPALDGGDHVVLAEQLDLLEALADDHERRGAAEVVVVGAIVDDELAVAGASHTRAIAVLRRPVA